MAHRYEVHTSDGQAYHVDTPHHHDDHDDHAFSKHLLDVLKGAAGGIASGIIIRYIYRGRH